MFSGIKIKTLFSWHRYMGLTVALFVLILAGTGIMLNHTEDFQLDSKFIQNNWLLNLYNIKAPENITAFKINNLWVSQLQDQLYLNTSKLETQAGQLVGAVITNEYIVIATASNLFLLTLQGELVESISSAHGLPTPIEQIGLSRDNKLVVYTTQGIYRADVDELSWTDYSSSHIRWATKTTLPATLLSTILELYRNRDLSYERILLDLHSGRLLPKLGIYIMDTAAVLMMLLAITGVWVWYSIKRRKRRNATN